MQLGMQAGRPAEVGRNMMVGDPSSRNLRQFAVALFSVFLPLSSLPPPPPTLAPLPHPTPCQKVDFRLFKDFMYFDQ